ncbi:NADH dehydrogenase, FAD-containing subunit [Rhodospirillales bacterium URHD0017]|nr:NADH dehydrogenase, FAD-containing subunit [Rhodospirillales bacterium URHD0017]
MSGRDRRILILGGGYAGLTAMSRLARLGLDAEIVLVDQRSHWSERIRLHELAVGGKARQIDLADFAASLSARFVRARITALSPSGRVVGLETAGGGSTWLRFDHCILALGSSVDDRAVTADALPDAPPVVRLESATEAHLIHDVLVRRPTAKVLIVGGGLTGVEAACEIAEAFPATQVTLASASAWRQDGGPGSFSRVAVQHLANTLQRLGVTSIAGRVLECRKGVARMADGAGLPYDICVWTTGFAPNELAQASGVAVTSHRQVVVDHTLRSVSHRHILAVGDLAFTRTPASGPCRMGCVTALPMGAAAARTVAALLSGRELPGFEFDYLFRCVSLGRADGLIQFVDSRDRPRRLVWTGRKAAIWKDYICRTTLATIGVSAMPAPPVVPPLTMLLPLLRSRRQYA